MTTVLIVDDSALDRELAKRILAEDSELTIETADNGRSGLDRVNAGGIDIVVNNASAISLTGTVDTTMKRYDLMHHINTRGTFLV